MSLFHKDAPVGDIHIIHQFSYADATAKAAASGFVSSDVGKVALQIDTATYYILTATTPTWQKIGDGTAANLTGTLAVGKGGTGATTLTAHGVVVGNGTSAVSVTAAGTSGQPLLSGGASADPAYGTLGVAAGGTGLTTLTANNVMLGNGTSSPSFVAPSTSGNTLQSNGTTWVSASNPAPVLSVVSKTANYSVTSSDDIVTGSASGGSFTLTLPDATIATKKAYRLTRTDTTTANTITINTTSAQTVGKYASGIIKLYDQDDALEIYPDGSNWQISSWRYKRQVVVGAAQTSDDTLISTTYAAFATNDPTVSITASTTGNYKVYGNFMAYNGASGQTVGMKVAATVGSPTTVFNQDVVANQNVTSALQSYAPYAVFTLTAGTAYTFKLQAKSSSGTLTLANSLPASGHSLIVEQIS